MLKFQYFGHLMWRANSLEKILMLGKVEGRRRRVWQRMRWLGGIIDLMDLSFSRLWEIVRDMEAWHSAVHEDAKKQTHLSNWLNNNSLKQSSERDCARRQQICVQTWTVNRRHCDKTNCSCTSVVYIFCPVIFISCINKELLWIHIFPPIFICWFHYMKKF